MMPFVEEEIGQFAQIPVDDQKSNLDSEAPTVGETLRAGFRRENGFVSAAATGFKFASSFDRQEGYDPFQDEDLTGYKLFADSFIDSDSPEQTSHIKLLIDQELEDRKTLAASGAMGFAAVIAAGVTDPIYLPLMFTGVGALRIGTSLAKSFGKTAGVGAVSEIAAEAAKHLSQETRSIEESFINVGGAALLSGILGAGISALSTKQFNTLSKKADEILADDPPLSAGAAEVIKNSMEELELVNAAKIEQWGVSPLVRTSTSPVVETRRIISSMVETPLVTKGNVTGKATAPEGGAVETRVKLWDAPMVEALTGLDQSYLKYRQGKGTVRRAVDDYILKNTESKLSRRDFRIEVGKAMRRGDKHNIPEVAEASASFRQKVFDPLKDAAIEGGLLPPDVTTTTAVSYLTRIYKHNKIIAKRNEWDGVVQGWLKGIRQQAFQEGSEVIEGARDIIGDFAIDAADPIGSFQKVARRLDEITETTKEALDIKVGEIKEIRSNVDDIKETLTKVDKNLSVAKTAENEIQREVRATVDRFIKFKPEKGSEEFTASINKTEKAIGNIDKRINELSIEETTLTKEAQTQLTRFLSDRAKGLEKREKAFSQNFVRIENRLAKIRGDLAGKRGQRESLLDSLAKKTENLKPLQKGNKAKVTELKIALTRLQNRLKKSTEKATQTAAKLDEAQVQIRAKREALTKAIAERRLTEESLKASRKIARNLSAKIKQSALSDAEIAEVSDALTDNVLGNASGRVPYDMVALARGPLKERTLNIPDELIEDFLESDIDLVTRQYVRTMAPDVELDRMFGDVTMKSDIQEINNAYDRKIKKATTEKQRVKLNKRREADVLDVEAMRDRLRGTYRMPEDPNSFFLRAGRGLRDVNFMRMLGGMTISAIPDLARPIAVNGLKPLARSIRAMAFAPKTFKMARGEAKKAAVGMDMVLNSRAASMAEISDIYARGTKFERGLRKASDGFSKITLMSQWNTALKQFSGVMTQDRLLGEAVKWADGTISKNNIRRMAQAGIDQGLAVRIAEQFKKHGDDGTLRLSNGHLWNDTGALETFRAAVLKDVDRTIVTPGVGEKPLWTSSETGKLIFQFKTFASSAHHKILLADLQHRDLQALNGFLLSVALGSATYGLKQFVAGREISKDPEKLIVESLDRSGAFGYFWDINNMIEKGTRGNFGVNSLLGAPPMSRYATRNITGAMLGPSLGTAEDIIQVVGGASSGEFSQKELKKLRRLLPGQNLFYMRRLLNELEREAGRGLPK